MSVLYMVSNGKVGDHMLMTMGHSHNMRKRLPAPELLDAAPPDLDVNYRGFIDDLDWFVWEPVESAHVVDSTARHAIDDARLDAVAVPAGMPTALRIPFGRFAEAHKVVRICLPCTTRDLLTLIREVYDRPATAADVEAVRAAKGANGLGDDGDDDGEDDGNNDDEYTRAALKALANGRSVKLVDLCGYTNYSVHRLDEGRVTGEVINEVTGHARLEAKLNWPARRHPLGDCMGMVRFEGLTKGNGSWLDVLVGS
jgi:hypothetical protein